VSDVLAALLPVGTAFREAKTTSELPLGATTYETTAVSVKRLLADFLFILTLSIITMSALFIFYLPTLIG